MMQKIILIFSLLISLSTFASGANFNPQSYFKDGDLIFQKSTSAQRAALEEATGSPWTHVGILFSANGKWYVAEAAEPVKITPIDSFINRGEKKEYRVYRHKDLDVPNPAVKVKALKNELSSYVGRSYDIYFEWSDNLIYCSELVYKSFQRALGIEIGVIQKFADLNLNGPEVQKLIRERLGRTGRTVNLEEPIVTPVAQLNDPHLKIIYRSH